MIIVRKLVCRWVFGEIYNCGAIGLHQPAAHGRLDRSRGLVILVGLSPGVEHALEWWAEERSPDDRRRAGHHGVLQLRQPSPNA